MTKAKETVITLNKEVDEKLQQFKRVFDTVVEEEIDYNDYVNTVISIGMDSMLRTMIPSDQEWVILQTAFDNHHEMMCKLIADMWQKDIQSIEDTRKRVRKDMENYIR